MIFISRRNRRILKTMGIASAAGVILGVFIWIIYLGILSSSSITGQSVVAIEPELAAGNIKVETNSDFNLQDKEDYIPVKMEVSPGRVFLTNNCTAMAVATTLEKTERLSRALSGHYELRPEEPDLLEEVIDVFDIHVDSMSIDAISDGIFYGSLILYDNDRVLRLDSRPSDALFIASRFSAPLYIHQDVFWEFAEEVC